MKLKKKTVKTKVSSKPEVQQTNVWNALNSLALSLVVLGVLGVVFVLSKNTLKTNTQTNQQETNLEQNVVQQKEIRVQSTTEQFVNLHKYDLWLEAPEAKRLNLTDEAIKQQTINGGQQINIEEMLKRKSVEIKL